jgi:hypothetical protein
MICANCPFGFEDGHIVGYCARGSRLELEYEFWNEIRGKLVFERFVGVRDQGAVGAEVGAFSEMHDSEYIACLARRFYEDSQEVLDWKHFRFVVVDGTTIFEVVAPTCSFVGPNSPNRTEEGNPQ